MKYILILLFVFNILHLTAQNKNVKLLPVSIENYNLNKKITYDNYNRLSTIEEKSFNVTQNPEGTIITDSTIVRTQLLYDNEETIVPKQMLQTVDNSSMKKTSYTSFFTYSDTIVSIRTEGPYSINTQKLIITSNTENQLLKLSLYFPNKKYNKEDNGIVEKTEISISDEIMVTVSLNYVGFYNSKKNIYRSINNPLWFKVLFFDQIFESKNGYFNLFNEDSEDSEDFESFWNYTYNDMGYPITIYSNKNSEKKFSKVTYIKAK